MKLLNNPQCLNLKIALCEIYNKDLHGLTENSSRDIQEHILATYLFDLEEFYDVEGVNDILNMMQNEYSYMKIYHMTILEIIKI